MTAYITGSSFTRGPFLVAQNEMGKKYFSVKVLSHNL